MRRSPQKFTLIELIITMVMMTVILTAVTPQLSRFMKSRNINGEVKKIIALSRYAGSTAVSRGVDIGLIVSPVNGTLVVSEQYGAYSSSDVSDDLVMKKIELADGIILEVSNTALNSSGDLLIVFHSDGFSEGADDAVLKLYNKYDDSAFDYIKYSKVSASFKRVSASEITEKVVQ